MPLLDKLVGKAEDIVVNFKYLESALREPPPKKQKAIYHNFYDYKESLSDIYMRVTRNTQASSLAQLADRSNFLIAQHNGNTPASPFKAQKFRNLLALFEEIPASSPTITAFETPETHDTYKWFSKRFGMRHVAHNPGHAQKLATERHAVENQVVVCSYLTPSSAQYLNDEIRTLNKIKFFDGISEWQSTIAKTAQLTNTKIEEIVFRSKFQVQKWQCTQHNGFVAVATIDFIFYSVTYFPCKNRHERIVADHYRPTGEITNGDRLTNGYEVFDVTANKKSFDGGQWGEISSMLEHDDDGGYGVRVYSRKGRVVG
jgi:hypothetical protein